MSHDALMLKLLLPRFLDARLQNAVLVVCLSMSAQDDRFQMTSVEFQALKTGIGSNLGVRRCYWFSFVCIYDHGTISHSVDAAKHVRNNSYFRCQ